jgi:hypothetical protein
MKNLIVQQQMEAQLADIESYLKNTENGGYCEYHKGDIGNTGRKWNGTINLTTDEWNIGSGDPTKDILGKGLIVHELMILFRNPGNAGERVACSALLNREKQILIKELHYFKSQYNKLLH